MESTRTSIRFCVVSWCVEGFEKQDIEHNCASWVRTYTCQKQFHKLWWSYHLSITADNLSRIPLTQPKTILCAEARMVIPSTHTNVIAPTWTTQVLWFLNQHQQHTRHRCAMPEIRSYLTVYRVARPSQCKDNVIATTTNLLITDSVCVPRTERLAHIVKRPQIMRNVEVAKRAEQMRSVQQLIPKGALRHWQHEVSQWDCDDYIKVFTCVQCASKT